MEFRKYSTFNSSIRAFNNKGLAFGKLGDVWRWASARRSQSDAPSNTSEQHWVVSPSKNICLTGRAETRKAFNDNT